MTAAMFLTDAPKRRWRSSYDVQLAAEVRRNEQDAHENASGDVAERELEKGEVASVCAGGDADEAQRARFSGDDGEADAPPRDRPAGEEVIASCALEAREP